MPAKLRIPPAPLVRNFKKQTAQLFSAAMLVLALLCALAAFGLLVAAVSTPGDGLGIAVIVVASLGIVFWVIDSIQKRKKTFDNTGDSAGETGTTSAGGSKTVPPKLSKPRDHGQPYRGMFT